MIMEEVKSITDILEDARNDMCTNYCKYPDTWDEEKEGIELMDSEVCINCPLNRL